MTDPLVLGLDLRRAAPTGGTAEGAELPAPAIAPPPSLPPVSLSAAQAACRNALCARHKPLALRLETRQVQARLLAQSLPVPPDAPWLHLTLDGAPAAIALPWPLARRLAGQSLEAATAEDAALLLEDAIAPWLDAGEAATGMSLRFNALRRERPGFGDAVPVLLALTGMGGGAPFRQGLALALSTAAARRLADAMTPLRRPRDGLPGLMLRAAVETDSLRMKLPELASLRPGDALLLETEPAAGGLRAVVEDRLVAPLLPDGPGRWRLAGPLRPRARDTQTRDLQLLMREPMSDSDLPAARPKAEPAAQPQPQAQQPAGTTDGPPNAVPDQPRPTSLDGLEMRLSFRIGEALMSLDDLRNAGPGTVITVDRPDGALVDIVVNGQIIGQGEMITVAGQKACEIRQIFGDG